MFMVDGEMMPTAAQLWRRSAAGGGQLGKSRLESGLLLPPESLCKAQHYLGNLGRSKDVRVHN